MRPNRGCRYKPAGTIQKSFKNTIVEELIKPCKAAAGEPRPVSRANREWLKFDERVRHGSTPFN